MTGSFHRLQILLAISCENDVGFSPLRLRRAYLTRAGASHFAVDADLAHSKDDVVCTVEEVLVDNQFTAGVVLILLKKAGMSDIVQEKKRIKNMPYLREVPYILYDID